jgi:hypothetical protein
LSVVAAVLTASSGFLLAVIWMDLIFDSQVRAHRHVGAELPEPVLATIAAYYHRATTTSRPMSWLIATVMAILLAALAFEATGGQQPAWLLVTSAVLGGGPILLASVRTVRNAVRLGMRVGDPAEQSRLARSIYRDHVVSLACMLAFLVVWLTRG